MTQIDELAKRMREHVVSRGGQARDENGEIVVTNGAWQMMLAAAAELTRLRERNAELEKAMVLYREAVRIDPMMEGPRFAGANSSALRRAWEHDRATIASSESVLKLANDEVVKISATLDALTKAIKPFADLGAGSGPDHETETYRIERGAIRQARAALDAAAAVDGDAGWNAAISRAAHIVIAFGVKDYTAEEVAARIRTLKRG